MATITFYENSDLDGIKRTFSYTPSDADALPYTTYNDLSEYNFDNSSKSVGNSINSLTTGDNTWVYLFKKNDFSGQVIRFGPNSKINSLQSYYDVNYQPGNNIPVMPDMNNSINSFIIYSSEPNSWDVTDPNDTSASVCWVKLFSDKRFTRSEFCLTGEGDVIDTDCIVDYRYCDPEAATFGDVVWVYKYPQSLTTGPETAVFLYNDVNFTKACAQFGPNSVIPDLSKYCNTQICSLKVVHQDPNNWIGDTSQTPNMVFTLEKFDTGSSLECLLAGVIGSIPDVGCIAAGIMGAFWPSGPDDQLIWNDLDCYMTALVGDIIDENNLDQLKHTLQGLATAIKFYNTMVPGEDKAVKLANILDDLQNDSDYYLDTTNPQNNLTYLVQFATITVTMFSEQVYNYTTLSGGLTDNNAKAYSDYLVSSISTLTKAVANANTNALAWRLGNISMIDGYTLSDIYTGYSQKFDTQSAANNAYAAYVSHVTAQYQLQLDAICQPANLWKYFLPSNAQQVADSGNEAFPTTVFATKPTQQFVHINTGTYGQNTSTNTFTINCEDKRITGVYLDSNGSSLTGIQLAINNQLTPYYGTKGSYRAYIENLDSDEFIDSMYGGSGSWIDQLYIRTNKGRDFGVGGTGGTFYIATPPQGMNASITSITGCLLPITGGYVISQLTINWKYEVYS
jgi:hypothetical protein